jgi:hypothetical protein
MLLMLLIQFETEVYIRTANLVLKVVCRFWVGSGSVFVNECKDECWGEW